MFIRSHRYDFNYIGDSINNIINNLLEIKVSSEKINQLFEDKEFEEGTFKELMKRNEHFKNMFLTENLEEEN